MTNIYLVRHTNYENPEDICAGRLPFVLSKEGLVEAERLKKFFQNKDIHKIYSSQVERCKQTATIISNEKIPIEFDLRILETMTLRQGVVGNNGYNYYGYRHIVGGESNVDVQKRMIEFFENINWEDNKNYIICSHGDPLYFLYQYLAKIQITEEIELDQPFPEYPNYPSRGSVRIISRENANEEWKVGKLIEQSELAS